MSDLDFRDKCYIVTGGASGIGAACVRMLVERGARVAALDRAFDGLGLPRAPEGVGNRDGLALRVDVASAQSVDAAFGDVLGRFGSLDGVVHCAGITRDGVIWKLSDEDWATVLSVNLTGTFNVLRAAAPFLRARNQGSIVAVSSINGLRGKFGQANYAASKAGVVGLVKTAARELGGFGIRVNAVAPGLVRTPMTTALPDEVVKKALDEAVLKRTCEPEDVGATVLFLLSDLARHVTGQTIRVDGGQYM